MSAQESDHEDNAEREEDSDPDGYNDDEAGARYSIDSSLILVGFEQRKFLAEVVDMIR